MKLNELEVLQLLKDKLIDAAKTKGLKLNDSDFGSKRWNTSEKRVFYLQRLENNLFERPSPSTVLGTGAEAVRSSAAMIYNLLGEKDIVLNGMRYSGIEYEKPFPAIMNEHNAHLDAIFHSPDNTEMYAIEAKLLEWKDSPKNLAKAYLKEDMYFATNKQRQVFIEFFRSLIRDEQDSKGRYKHKSKRYDAIQMAIHTLALFNHFSQETTSNIKKLTLLNVVWKYDCDKYAKEEEEAHLFIENANAEFTPIFKKLGIDFSIQYATFQDFKKYIIDLSNDPKRLNYLKRYEVTA